MALPHALRAARRSGHGAQPLRAARAARAAERRARPAGAAGRSGIALGLAATFTVTIVGLASVIDGVGLGPGRHADAGRRRAHRLRHRRAPCRRWPRAWRRRWRGCRAWARAGAATASRRACSSAPRWASSTRRARGRSWPPSSPSAPPRRARCPSASPSRWARRSCCSRSRWAGARSPGACAPPGAARACSARWRVVLILTGVAMATNLDVRFQSAIANHLPAALVNPDAQPGDVARRLQPAGRPARPVALRGRGHRAPGRRRGASLPRLGAAPDFTGNQRWFNTPGGRPLSLRGAARQGRARRLLDLHVHQLPAHAALPRGVGRALSPRRPGHRRRALARVPLRARRRQRRRAPSSARGSATRWRRTTSSRPGTPGATSTGPPTT